MITVIASILKKGLTSYELEAGLALDTIVQILLICLWLGWIK